MKLLPTHPLPAILLCMIGIFSGNSYSAPLDIVVGGSGTNLGSLRALLSAFTQQHPAIHSKVLSSLGSSGAMRALHAGKITLAATSRPLSEKEASGVRFVRYATTPFQFAVASNAHAVPPGPVDKQQIREIYCPDNSMATPAAHFRPIIRPKSDSDTLMLLAAFPDLSDCIMTPYGMKGFPVATSDQEAASMMESIPRAIGTTSLTVIRSEGWNLTPVLVEDEQGNVRPIGTKSLFLAIAEEAGSSQLRAFLQFILSPQGQQILRETGNEPIPFTLPD